MQPQTTHEMIEVWVTSETTLSKAEFLMQKPVYLHHPGSWFLDAWKVQFWVQDEVGKSGQIPTGKIPDAYDLLHIVHVRKACIISETETLKQQDLQSGDVLVLLKCESRHLDYYLALILAEGFPGKLSDVPADARRVSWTQVDRSESQKHVFLSYCHDNFEQARQLHDALAEQGFDVWWDRNILPGQDWKREIRTAIKRSFAVIACFSREVTARDSTGMYPELRSAIGVYCEQAPGSVFLIPVRFSFCDIPELEIDSTRTLKDLQYADLFPAEKWNDRLAELAVSLRTARSRVLVPKGRGVQDSRASERDILLLGRNNEASAFVTAIRAQSDQTVRELIDSFWARATWEDGSRCPAPSQLTAFAWQTGQELDDTIQTGQIPWPWIVLVIDKTLAYGLEMFKEFFLESRQTKRILDAWLRTASRGR